MEKTGALTQLTLAWSRDGVEKVYVQHRIREQGEELRRWLEDGAHFYVCGDAKNMAKEVELALVDVIATFGLRSTEAAKAFVSGLLKKPESFGASALTQTEASGRSASLSKMAFCGLCPNEGLGGLVVMFDVAGDFGFEFGNGFEDATADFSASDGREEALDRIQPWCRCRREVERPARVIVEPFHDGGMLVRRVIVENGVDDLASRNGALDGGQEADELLMPMLLHAAPDDGSVENVERREQGGHAVALIIVGHGPAFSGFQRQAGLSAVERLDLAFFVDGDDDGVRRRVHVETDDVFDFLREVRITRAFEGSDAVRLTPMLFPQALNGAQRNSHGLGHGATGPMSGGAGWFGAGQLENFGDNFR